MSASFEGGCQKYSTAKRSAAIAAEPKGSETGCFEEHLSHSMVAAMSVEVEC